MFKKDKFLFVNAQNECNEDLYLYFDLFDMDIVDRWINLVDKNNQANHSIRYNYNRFLTEEEKLNLFQSFLDNINYINKHYDRILLTTDSLYELKDNQDILNVLHEEFEIYGQRLEKLIAIRYFDNPTEYAEFHEIWPGLVHNKLLHESFLLLNEQIHNLEAVFDHWDKVEPYCSCHVDFVPSTFFNFLKPEDFILFDCYREWGSLFLGYNTLGKHYISAWMDNDIDVVLEKRIKPQKRFAAEMFMTFESKTRYYETRINFYNWWMKNNFSSFIDPCMKINELAFGFIKLGKINSYSINKNDVVPIDNNLDKQKWNMEVWSKFNKIVSAEIVSDITRNIDE